MREILFRGKRLDNGEWVEGDLRHGGYYLNDPNVYIVVRFADTVINYPVAPSTVGQYTGLKDKNGRRIFEGDELAWHNGSGTVNFSNNGCFCVRLHGEIEYYGRNNPAIDIIFNLYPELEVIGNIHDNPEMYMEEA